MSSSRRCSPYCLDSLFRRANHGRQLPGGRVASEQPVDGRNEGFGPIKRTHEFVVLPQLADGRGAHQYEISHRGLTQVGHSQSIPTFLYREGVTQNEQATGLCDRDLLGVGQIGHCRGLKACSLQHQAARFEQVVLCRPLQRTLTCEESGFAMRPGTGSMASCPKPELDRASG